MRKVSILYFNLCKWQANNYFREFRVKIAELQGRRSKWNRYSRSTRNVNRIDSTSASVPIDRSFVFSDVITTRRPYALSCRVQFHSGVLQRIFLAREGTEYWWDAWKYLVDWSATLNGNHAFEDDASGLRWQQNDSYFRTSPRFTLILKHCTEFTFASCLSR